MTAHLHISDSTVALAVAQLSTGARRLTELTPAGSIPVHPESPHLTAEVGEFVSSACIASRALAEAAAHTSADLSTLLAEQGEIDRLAARTPSHTRVPLPTSSITR